jgi:hypothetical protein
MPDVRRIFSQGLVTSRDRAQLSPGELQQATGIYHKPGDQRAWKLPGRSEFDDTGSGSDVTGLALCQFDAGGTDKLLALSNGTLYSATPGATGTFASLLTTTGVTLDAAHANDKWYLALGTENKVVLNDGTTREMGMQPPSAPLTYTTTSAGGTVTRPTSNTGSFTTPDLAQDTDDTTFAYKSANSAAGSGTGTWLWSAGTGTGRKLYIMWSLKSDGKWAGGTFGTKVRVILSKSENSGANFTSIVDAIYTSPVDPNTLVVDIADGTNLSALHFKANLLYMQGTKSIDLRIHDIRVQDATTGAAVSATALLYAYLEFDEDSGILSPPSDILTVTFSSQRQVNLTLPATAKNSNATQFWIYRTPDGGTNLQLGKIGSVPVGQTTFSDDFTQFATTDQPPQLVQYLQVEFEGTVLYFPRDFPPPNLSRITYFKGGLCGLSPVNTRALFYSEPGFPESWPEINVIEKFPIPEHDELVTLEEIGASLILAGKDVMIRLDEVPRTSAGTFIASEAVPIKGAPGCVGPEAMTVVNYEGVSHVAWLSPENGVLVTDGHRWRPITLDIDWSVYSGFDKSGWVLRWLKHLRILVLAYSSTSGGTNDRYLLLHMDESHLKQNGQAKITGPHYGMLSSLASGEVSSTTRIYSGASDGSVYLEFDGTTGLDASASYSGSIVPLILQSGREYEEWLAWSALDARLYHTDFGDGETIALAYTVGRDASDFEATRDQTISLEGQKGTQFDIARSGEWHEFVLTHTGAGSGALSHILIRARVLGREGKMQATA